MVNDSLCPRIEVIEKGRGKNIMRVIVTGATGAIGTALIQELINNEIEVLVFCREGSKRNSQIPESKFVTKRFCSLSQLAKVQNDTGKAYDIFYHFAWEGTTGDARNNMYLQNLFCSPNLPIETHNLLNCIKESVTYKKHFEALQLKISYLTVQNDLKKNRNATILNILLYVISLIGAIGTLDVIEEHFGVPFEQGFIVVILLFIFGLIWWIIEYQSNRRL